MDRRSRQRAGNAPGITDGAAGKATIPFNRPSIVGDEIDFMRDSIRRGQLSGDGHYTKQCNAAIQRITALAQGVDHP